jgi:hypothetical protein
VSLPNGGGVVSTQGSYPYLHAFLAPPIPPTFALHPTHTLPWQVPDVAVLDYRGGMVPRKLPVRITHAIRLWNSYKSNVQLITTASAITCIVFHSHDSPKERGGFHRYIFVNTQKVVYHLGPHARSTTIGSEFTVNEIVTFPMRALTTKTASHRR